MCRAEGREGAGAESLVSALGRPGLFSEASGQSQLKLPTLPAACAGPGALWVRPEAPCLPPLTHCKVGAGHGLPLNKSSTCSARIPSDVQRCQLFRISVTLAGHFGTPPSVPEQQRSPVSPQNNHTTKQSNLYFVHSSDIGPEIRPSLWPGEKHSCRWG